MDKHKYRVREGFTYGAFGQFGPGSIVELTEEEAKHVMDKLELAEIIHNVPDESAPLLPPLPVHSPDGSEEIYSDGGAEVPWNKEEDVVIPAPRSRSTKKSGD